MTEIAIPDNEMNEFDLPRIDVVTGATEAVVFKPVRFQWYPRWVAGFAIAPIIFIILALVLMRRTKGELPFTEASFAAWRRGKLAFGVALTLSILLLVVGLAALDDHGALGGTAMLAALVVPIAVGLTMVRNKGPVVVRIDKGLTVIKVPSQAAAAAFKEHLTAGPAPVR